MGCRPQDITFPNLACSLITLDTSEVSGERHMNVHDGHLLKRRLDKQVRIEPRPTAHTASAEAYV